EADALKKLALLLAPVLVGFEDVGAVACEHLSQRGHQAMPVGAGDQQGGDVGGGREGGFGRVGHDRGGYSGSGPPLRGPDRRLSCSSRRSAEMGLNESRGAWLSRAGGVSE